LHFQGVHDFVDFPLEEVAVFMVLMSVALQSIDNA
jgi:hypothetical protein